MNYHILLTGATGLLGRYLLRDLLLADTSVAVLVRRGRRQNAAERVEAMMLSWESMLGRELPRPHVLEGDLTKPNLGLDDDELAWVEQNCDSVLHNAASLTFISSDPEGEPWISNVTGTQNVLDVCEKTGIKDFHHVSTSYVCGLRDGDVFENELDEGQEWGNDYERSKVQAETLVRNAKFLSPPTFYRPAIIVGDSKTGFTTSFHGFYATLHLTYTLKKSMSAEMGHDPSKPTRITLDGDECKNFVPVDWVSAVTTHVVTNREFHGQTYHLTPETSVSATEVKQVLDLAIGFEGSVFHGAGKPVDDPSEIEQLFYEHIRVYNSYWRDDPKFDGTNTRNAAPHLPCPTIDFEMLLMMANKAIQMDFRWKEKVLGSKVAASSN
ncbi:MAG: SDR family oxidoreductase [Planctomycetales bacterium]|jgi:thioester reductase-like protein